MLRWALLFFVLALVCIFLGWGGAVSGYLMSAAQLCVFLFIVLAVISLIMGRGIKDPLA